MSRSMRPILLFLAAAVLAMAAAGAVSADEATRFTGVMEKFTRQFNAGDYEGIYVMFNEVMAGKMPKDKMTAAFKAMAETLGKITKVGPAEVVNITEARFVLAFERGVVDARLALDSGDKISGLAFNRRPSGDKVPERQSTPLRTPFEGVWLTTAGGDTPTQNYHVSGHPSQRCAYDFVVAGPDGQHYKNLGKKNEDYYVFGRKVLAPADGVVMEVISGIRDNKPGTPNLFMSIGNAVIIQHKAGEYSLLAHLKFGSIVVARGAKVKAGQVVALCGNTGSTAEPQLHFSLMNQADLMEATGIKALFRKVKVTRDGKTAVKADYAPVKGDLIGQG